MRFSLYKLALNVGSFALIYAVHVPFSFYVIFKKFDCSETLNDRTEMLTLYGITRNIVQLRIIIDPIISFCTDNKVRGYHLSARYFRLGRCHEKLALKLLRHNLPIFLTIHLPVIYLQIRKSTLQLLEIVFPFIIWSRPTEQPSTSSDRTISTSGVSSDIPQSSPTMLSYRKTLSEKPYSSPVKPGGTQGERFWCWLLKFRCFLTWQTFLTLLTVCE
jgi:hypothetical protein